MRIIVINQLALQRKITVSNVHSFEIRIDRRRPFKTQDYGFKGCVQYIFAILISMSKRKHF